MFRSRKDQDAEEKKKEKSPVKKIDLLPTDAQANVEMKEPEEEKK